MAVKVGTLFYELNAGGNILDVLKESKQQALELKDTIIDINKTKIINESNKSYDEMLKNKRAAALEALAKQRLARENEINTRNADRHALAMKKLTADTLRNEAATKRLSASQRELGNYMGLTNKTLFSQRNLLNQLSNAAGIYFSIYEVGRFVKNLAQVSGEFEQQHIALRAILRDADSADRIFAQIKELSVVSPFTFKDLTNYAKQLSAFQVPVDELYDTTKRLADVSAGLGVDMSRIILAYGQVRSASVLRGQELRQFTEAGIPLVDELAKKFGELEKEAVSANEVFDKISTRQVPFEMVKEVFQEMTEEGGMFYNMQEKLAESLAGKMSNLTDAYQIMLSDIGKANDGILKGGVEALTSFMEHWETFADILKTIIASYGVYKASIITANVLQRVFGKELDFTNAKLKVQSFLLKSNPWGIALSAITAIVGGIYTYVSSLNRANKELLENITTLNKQKDSVNNIFEKLKKVNKEQQNVTNNVKDTNELQKQNNSLTAKRVQLLDELSKKEPEVAKSIKDHADNMDELIKVQEKYNAIMDARKYAEYTIKETEGWFDDSLVDDLKDFEEQQNKTSLSAAKLELTYTKIREIIDQITKSGGYSKELNIGIGKDKLNEINQIIKSTDNYADKVINIQKLLFDVIYSRSYVSTKFFDQKDLNNIRDYSKSLTDLKNTEKEVSEEISKRAEILRQSLSLRGIDVYAKENEKYVRYFVKSLSDLTEYGQKTILTKWNIEFNGKSDPEDTLEGWRKELDEITGKKYTAEIRASIDVKDAVKTLQDELKEVNDDINKVKPILINAGYNFDTESLPSILNEQAKEINESFVRQYKGLKSNQDSLMKGLGLLGALPTENTSGKDPVTENLKTQLDLIKEAISQYKKLREVMSEGEAVSRVKSIPGFEGIDAKYFKDNGMESALTDFLNRIQKRNTEAAKKVRDTWNKELRDIKTDELTKNIRKELSNIQNYIDRYVSQYNLYEQLLGTTGRKDLSFRLAFDANTQGLDILDFMKGQLEKMLDSSGYKGMNFFDVLKLTDEQKNQLPKEIQSLFDSILSKSEEMKNATKVQVAEAIGEYQRYEQEIDSVISKYDDLIAKARQLGLSQSDINAIEGQKNKKVSDLKFEQFKQSEDWALAFEDLDKLSTSTIKRLIASLEELKNSEKDMDVVNMKELVGLMGKLRGEVIGRNPFKTLSSSIKEYKSAIKDLKRAEDEKKTIENGGKVAKGWQLDKETNKMIPKYKSLAEAEEEVSAAQNKVVRSSISLKDAIEGNIDVITSATSSASEFASSVSEAFAAFGNEDQADKWGMASEAIGMFGDTLGDVTQKISRRDFIGAAMAIISLPAKLAASFAEFHDKKLDREIEKSELLVKRLGDAYKNLEWQIERTYGEDNLKKTGELVANIQKQQAEIAAQRDLERQKKNKDNEALADYEQQLIELEQKRIEVYESIRNKVFDSVSSMASQLGGALVEAFRNGEDAAKAWGDTVDDIVLKVITNLMATKYIEPVVNEWMEDLENSIDLSGSRKQKLKDDLNQKYKEQDDILKLRDLRYRTYKITGGNLSKEDYFKTMPEYKRFLQLQADTQKDINELTRLVNMSDEEKLKIFGESGEGLKDKLDNLEPIKLFEEFIKKYIGDNNATAEGITKSAQSLTEETGNLLASYTNAIRADVSVMRRILEESEIRRANMVKVYMETITQYPNVFNQIALMQADIKRIEANTFRSANNSDVILQGVNEMNTRFRQATTPGSGIRINI